MSSDELITFSLPVNDVILKFLQMKPGDQIKSIALGMRFITTGTEQMQGWINGEWETKLAEEKDRATTAISSYVGELREEREKQRLMEESHKKELIDTAEYVKGQTKARSQTELSGLREQLERKDITISKLNEENRSAFKDAYTLFDSKAILREEGWETKMNLLRIDYEERLMKEKEHRESLIATAQNSTILGQIGENFTLCELNKRFPQAEIEDTHKQSGRGDFIMKDRDFSMLIETKNYKNNVTKPEIDKFYRDIDTNHDIKCGILISLKSGICSREDFHLEVRDKKPILFLHNVSSNMENVSLAVILFKLILGTDTIDLSHKEIEEKLKNCIPMVKRNWNKMRQQIKKFEQDMIECVTDQESLVRNMFELIGLVC